MRIHSLVICLLKWSLLPRQVKDEKPPAPTRGVAPKGEDEEDGGEAVDSNSSKGGEDAGVVNLADLVPRNDIRFANVLLLFCVRMKKYTLKEALSITALHACVYIDILKLSSFRVPTLLFIRLSLLVTFNSFNANLFHEKTTLVPEVFFRHEENIKRETKKRREKKPLVTRDANLTIMLR